MLSKRERERERERESVRETPSAAVVIGDLRIEIKLSSILYLANLLS